MIEVLWNRKGWMPFLSKKFVIRKYLQIGDKEMCKIENDIEYFEKELQRIKAYDKAMEVI